MKSQYFKIIAPLIFICFAESSFAIQNDSLQNFLEKKLLEASFKEKKDVLDYLEITDQIYPNSPSEALFYINMLEEKLESEKIEIGKEDILNKKGIFYWQQGIYDAALKAFFEALSIFEQEGNNIEVIKALNNIGETYKKQKDYIQSAKFIQLALSKSDKAKDFAPELILVNLGQLFMLNENYDSANYYLNQVLSKDSISNQTKGFANLYKGMINLANAKNDSAHFYLQESLKYWEKLNYARGIVESNIEIARVYVLQNNLEKANQRLKQAEQLALNINTLDLLLKIYQSKIELFKINGSKDSLVFYFDKYLEIQDSIFNAESRAEINKLSIQYNLSQKEKESYKLALEQSQLANKIENRTQFLILLIVALIFSIVTILYLRNKSNQLKNAHIKLKQQKEEIEEKQKKISSKSLDLARVNKELHNLNKNLEKRVLERTRKLNERNRQIAEFTYYNSHKLRAPVANVLGLINVIELTKDGKIDPTVLNYLKISATELDKVIFNLKNLLELDEELDQ
ncbi:tetratricopeptide repeat protein [Marivirga tractuosa]|uniref:tetratricopeptide repeat protein n=1 Tax=Marivirga tractuosa TaxID=1006 RepID=UPI0035CE8B27